MESMERGFLPDGFYGEGIFKTNFPKVRSFILSMSRSSIDQPKPLALELFDSKIRCGGKIIK